MRLHSERRYRNDWIDPPKVEKLHNNGKHQISITDDYIERRSKETPNIFCNVYENGGRRYCSLSFIHRQNWNQISDR